jgi:hypothetical protein
VSTWWTRKKVNADAPRITKGVTVVMGRDASVAVK